MNESEVCVCVCVLCVCLGSYAMRDFIRLGRYGYLAHAPKAIASHENASGANSYSVTGSMWTKGKSDSHDCLAQANLLLIHCQSQC